MKAFELLAKPESWTKGAFARNLKKESIDSGSEDAVCWCVTGAIAKTYCYQEYSQFSYFLDKMKNDLKIPKEKMITTWNDDPNTTHEDVINLLKKLDI